MTSRHSGMPACRHAPRWRPVYAGGSRPWRLVCLETGRAVARVATLRACEAAAAAAGARLIIGKVGA